MVRDPLAGHIRQMATMICVANLQASLIFYRDRLGFRVQESLDHLAIIERDGILIYLFLESPPTEDKPGLWVKPPARGMASVILCFHVDDCRLVYQVLVEAGVEFLTPPKSPPWGGWRCFALDPDDYVIELEEAPDA